VVICLERGADLHMAQLMPLPLNVSCFSEIQIGFNFLVLAHPGSPGIRAVKRVCVRSFVFICFYRIYASAVCGQNDLDLPAVDILNLIHKGQQQWYIVATC